MLLFIQHVKECVLLLAELLLRIDRECEQRCPQNREAASFSINVIPSSPSPNQPPIDVANEIVVGQNVARHAVPKRRHLRLARAAYRRTALATQHLHRYTLSTFTIAHIIFGATQNSSLC